jgi:hypothetical protein
MTCHETEFVFVHEFDDLRAEDDYRFVIGVIADSIDALEFRRYVSVYLATSHTQVVAGFFDGTFDGRQEVWVYPHHLARQVLCEIVGVVSLLLVT